MSIAVLPFGPVTVNLNPRITGVVVVGEMNEVWHAWSLAIVTAEPTGCAHTHDAPMAVRAAVAVLTALACPLSGTLMEVPAVEAAIGVAAPASATAGAAYSRLAVPALS